MTILTAENVNFDITVPVLIIGGGACGLTAALAAHEDGAGVLVLERDSLPQGSTALSSGFVPACGTRAQTDKGVDDSAALMASDIQGKSHGRTNPGLLRAVCARSGDVIDWLSVSHGIEFELITGFLYPGHSALRMHATAARTGKSLMDALMQAAEAADIDIMCDAHVIALYADTEMRIEGVRIRRPNGTEEDIGCDQLILACNGYGGNPDMIAGYIPQMARAEYFGHTGNQGDAVIWGRELGAGLEHMSAYQGHGSVATPHGILITWALMMEGGLQVNADGHRFSNETLGYSEQAEIVLKQPGKIAWNIYDERLHQLGLEFDDYRAANDQSAVICAKDLAELAEKTGLPKENLRAAVAITETAGVDKFGRDWTNAALLEPPYYAIRVTGALFHTQGGLQIDCQARVLDSESGAPFYNLFAAGGAACGLSGPDVSGYLSGNGLLSAIILGQIAGKNAAAQSQASTSLA